MSNIRTSIAVAIIATGVIGVVAFGRNFVHEDDRLYDQLVTIKGKVQIVNHPDLGRTEGSYMSLLFQFDSCKKCLVVARTDADGKYEIGVTRGRYRVIVRDARGGGAPSHDMLAPGQPRYVDATAVVQPNQFDVNIVVPPGP